MDDKSNCPNCGAPRDGPVCEYCGTRFQDENIVTVELYADGEVVERIIRGEQQNRRRLRGI